MDYVSLMIIIILVNMAVVVARFIFSDATTSFFKYCAAQAVLLLSIIALELLYNRKK